MTREQSNEHNVDIKAFHQLELDNKYLMEQNEYLNKELTFTRYTINALKLLANQRDIEINEIKQELEKAIETIEHLKQQKSTEEYIEKRRSIISKLPIRHTPHSQNTVVRVDLLP